MFGRMFLKEWKERWGLLGLAAFAIGFFVLFYSFIWNAEEYRLYLTGSLYLIFLPVFALLLGSSGFSTEFRDSAWTYLFSRPVRKETLWLTKLVSLGAMLLFVFFLISFLKFVLPGFALTSRNLFSPFWQSPGIELQAFAFAISLLAFFISYSISFLHDRLFILIFVAALAIGLLFVFDRYFILFVMRKLYQNGFSVPAEFKDIWFFAGGAFLAASLLTFRKTDFSQPIKKSKRFIALVIPFLIIALLLSLGWAVASGSILPQKKGTWGFAASKDSVYFCTSRGIYRYDAADDSCRRIVRHAGVYSVTVRAGKIVFNSGYFGQLWSINRDGSDKTRLYPPSSSLADFGQEFVFTDVLISPDGDKALFRTLSSFRDPDNPVSNRRRRLQADYYLHTISLDGTDHIFKIKGRFLLLAWPESEDGIFISRSRRENSTYFTRIEMLNSEFDEVNRWEFAGRMPGYRTNISPNQNYIALIQWDKNNESHHVLLLNLNTGKLTDSLYEDQYSLREIRWSPDESVLAFLIRSPEKKLITIWSFDIESGQADQIASFPIEPGSSPIPGLCLSPSGKTIFYFEGKNPEDHLVSIDLKNRAITEIPLPKRCQGMISDIHAVGRKLIVSLYEKKPIWRLDLDTMDWKQVF